MICKKCNQDLIWGGDHTAKEYGIYVEGIVSNYTCANTECSKQTVLILYECLKKPQLLIDYEN